MLFTSYDDHPRRLITLKLGGKEWHSTAAELLARYFDHYRKLLHLNDFSPASQDEIAIQQMREKHALPDIEAGRFEAAIKKVRSLWASLPGAGYGQPENSLDSLQQAFVRAGGQVL
jgi:muramidase (phage lysozyme)